MKLKVTKLKPNRIFQNVVEQIEAAILNGDIKHGDTLPPEMKLKEMFDTSRGTIREALRVLEQKGLIAVKTGVGGGAVVKAMESDKLTESLALYVQTQNISFDHLAEFREGVEGLVAGLAAERANPEDIKQLRKILKKMESLIDQPGTGWKQFVEEDVKLHIAVAEIANNPIFIAVHKMVHDHIMGSYDRFSRFFTKKEYMLENCRDLSEIVDAIENGTADTARSLTRRHVSKFNRIMKTAEQAESI